MLRDCPSTKLVGRALAAIRLPADIRGQIGTLPADDCQVVLLRLIKGGFGDIWTQMESYALPELKKIAIQIEAIADNADDYTPAGARALLDMLVKAGIGVIVAMTSLTLLAVQDAINVILDAVKGFVNGAVKLPLL